ncbi:zinc-ribbon domain-containing protein [Halobacteriaceae archaeon SHR40]|uniref:zinc-ribbon domain-containing protein n=1 Tax=Halovenus amylolytica TaxID=2500550 RepID=UPI000FE346A4
MVGFIIFGWPKRQKTIGINSPGYCDHCQNQNLWYLMKTRRWATLFWIPILPIGRADYWLACDICGAAVEIETEQISEAKGMVETTKQYRSGEITEQEYKETYEEYTEAMQAEPEETDLDTPSETEDIRGIQ